MSDCEATILLPKPASNGLRRQSCQKAGAHHGEPHYCNGYSWTDGYAAQLAASVVDHPPHYGGDLPTEPIKVIEAWDLGFNLGNCVKYIARAGKKPGSSEVEDLTKAAWYLNRALEQAKAVKP